MTEIEQIKEDLIEWERDGMCAIDSDVIRSLITTIESQQIVINSYARIEKDMESDHKFLQEEYQRTDGQRRDAEMATKELQLQVESQKEEIELLQSLIKRIHKCDTSEFGYIQYSVYYQAVSKVVAGFMQNEYCPQCAGELKMPTITKFCDQETANKYYAELDKPPCKHGYRNLYCSQCAGEGK